MKRVILSCLVAASFSSVAADTSAMFSNLIAISHEDGFKKMVQVLNQEERNIAIAGGDTLFTYGLPKHTYSPSEMVGIYEEGNELKAKKIFSDTYRVKLKVNEIAIDGFGKNVVVAIVPTDNPYIKERVSFRGLSDDLLIEMKKGQKLDLICSGAEYIIKNVFAHNCQLTKDYVSTQSGGVVEVPELSDLTNEKTGYNLAKLILGYQGFREINNGSDAVYNMKDKELLNMILKSSKKTKEAFSKYQLT
ncbi:hypothetical protein OJ662_004460, partial [Salmonella enterica]|nr:hypothetical protein [Salmonella enterica]